MLPRAGSTLTFRGHALTLCCSAQAGLSREATWESLTCQTAWRKLGLLPSGNYSCYWVCDSSRLQRKMSKLEHVQKEARRPPCYRIDIFSQAAEMSILCEFMERLKPELEKIISPQRAGSVDLIIWGIVIRTKHR